MKNYYSSQGEKYEPESERRGYTSVDVMPMLIGHPWDEVSLAYLSALNPSSIRVIRYDDGETCDAMTGRITVHLSKKERIKSITQEVEVVLPDGVAHGDALRHALLFGGIDSQQCQWHNGDVSGYFYDGITGKYYKILRDGSSVEFPE